MPTAKSSDTSKKTAAKKTAPDKATAVPAAAKAASKKTRAETAPATVPSSKPARTGAKPAQVLQKGPPRGSGVLGRALEPGAEEAGKVATAKVTKRKKAAPVAAGEAVRQDGVAAAALESSEAHDGEVPVKAAKSAKVRSDDGTAKKAGSKEKKRDVEPKSEKPPKKKAPKDKAAKASKEKPEKVKIGKEKPGKKKGEGKSAKRKRGAGEADIPTELDLGAVSRTAEAEPKSSLDSGGDWPFPTGPRPA